MALKERINFILRFNPYLSSINGRLFAYLRQYKRTGYSTRERILKSISAYWSPFAAKWAGEDEDEVKSVALASINQLELQIQYIRDNFNLPQPQWEYLPKGDGNVAQTKSRGREERLVPPQAQIESEELESEEFDNSILEEKFLSNF